MVSGGRSWWTAAPTVLATSECLPSAPTVSRADSATGAPPFSRPRMPVTRPSVTTTSSTAKRSRTSAPSACAFSSSSASRTVRRGL
jgi:hypothetical protein